MAKKAGKKTQSNRSNKTRRNVRNRKNTKKQKRRTNKQNRKKRATRKRHGVKRGGAAEEPSRRLVLPAACIKGPFDNESHLLDTAADYISKNEPGMAALCFLQFTDTVNPIYREVATLLHAATSAEVFKQSGVVTADGNIPPESANEFFLTQMTKSHRLLTQIDKGKQLWQEDIDKYLQQFYDVRNILYEVHIPLSEFKSWSLLNRKLLNMFTTPTADNKIANDILKIISNLFTHPEIADTVKDDEFKCALFNYIHGRIITIFDDISRIVNTIAEDNPTIVMTVIDYLLSEDFIVRVLAKDDTVFIGGKEKRSFTVSFLPWIGVPSIDEPYVQRIIPFSSLVQRREALVRLDSFQNLMKTRLWFARDMIKEQRNTIIEWIKYHDFNPLLSTISHFFINVIPNITDPVIILGIINIFVQIFEILKNDFKKIITNPVEAGEIIYAVPTGIKTELKKLNELLLTYFSEHFDEIKMRFEQYIQKIIDKMLYVHYIINDNCSEMLRGNKNTIELVGDIKKITDKFNEEISREVQNTLAGLKKKARDRNKRGRERVSNMARENAAKQRAMAKVSKYYGKSRLGRSPSPEGRYFAKGYTPYKNATNHEVAVLERHQAEEKQHEGRAAAAEFIANAAEQMESSHNQGTSFAYSGP